jgi:hypothetical protein
VCYLKKLCGNPPEGTEENHKYFSYNSQYTGRGSNRAHPDSKSEALLCDPISSVTETVKFPTGVNDAKLRWWSYAVAEAKQALNCSGYYRSPCSLH